MRRLYKNSRIPIIPVCLLLILLIIGTSISVNEFKKYNSISDSLAIVSTFFSMPDASKDFVTTMYNNGGIESSQNNENKNIAQQQPTVNIQSPPETENIVETDPQLPIEPAEQNIIAKQPANNTPLAPGKGVVVTEQYLKGTSLSAIPYGAGFIKNVTNLSASDVLAYATQEPEFNIKKNGLPQVLIYHTHTTESYLEEDNGQFDLSFTGRTTDPEKNMVRVGDEITKELEAMGIAVIHDTTIHDYTYNGSYGRSAETIQNILNKYPSIEIALDIHRDAIVKTDEMIVKPTSVIDGKNVAQVMIIAGCDNGTMNMPNWPHNLKFAVRFQDKMESMFPGLTRPILFDYRSYNQKMTNGSLLVEVGSHANTLDEAIYAGQLVGKALASYLDEISS